MKPHIIIVFLAVLSLSSCRDWESISINLPEHNLNMQFYSSWSHPYFSESHRKIEVNGKSYDLPQNIGGMLNLNVFYDSLENVLVFQDMHTISAINLNKQCLDYEYEINTDLMIYCGRIEVLRSNTISFLKPDESDYMELNGNSRIVI